jgi:hypothetical protein
MPKGTGSLQVRGCVWWAIFTDENGRKIQMNTETDDLGKARRILACRAIRVVKARLDALREVRDEAQTAAGAAGHGEARDRAEHGASRRPVRHDVAQRGDRGTARGGKR